MTFLQIRQRVAEMLGLNNENIQADPNGTIQAKLKAWVNARYKVIAAKRSWNWLMSDTIIQTVVEVTTGTVTATTGSTTITFSSGPTLSAAGWFIQFSDSEDWYEISSHTAASTTAVLTTAFLGTTSSTLTYTLRKVYYPLPSTVGKILDIKQTRNDVALRYVSARDLDRLVPDRTSRGNPRWYTISGLDSSRNYRLELFPIPNVAMNLNVRHYAVATDMTADADVPLLPESYHDLLVWDVLGSYGYLFLDDKRVSNAKAEANELMKDLIKNDVAAEDVAVRRPYDVDLAAIQDLQLRQNNLPIA